MELAQFILKISTDIRSISNGIQLWDLTFRVDRRHILGALQFETRDRHQKIQAEAYIWMDDLTSIDPVTYEVTSYRVLSGLQISDQAVSTHVRQIGRALKYV